MLKVHLSTVPNNLSYATPMRFVDVQCNRTREAVGGAESILRNKTRSAPGQVSQARKGIYGQSCSPILAELLVSISIVSC